MSLICFTRLDIKKNNNKKLLKKTQKQVRVFLCILYLHTSAYKFTIKNPEERKKLNIDLGHQPLLGQFFQQNLNSNTVLDLL